MVAVFVRIPESCPGVLTQRDVLSMLPFANEVVKLEITGVTLRRVLEHGVARSGVDAAPGCFPQVSGVRFKFRTDRPEGSRVEDVTVNGKPLDDKKLYTVAATSFVAILGGDGYNMFEDARILIPREKAQTESDILKKAIQILGTINPKVDGRITRDENLDANLQSGASCISQRFNQSVAELKPITGVMSNGDSLSGYDAVKVKTILEETKAALLNDLNDEALGAMKGYVEQYFPLTQEVPTVAVKLEGGVIARNRIVRPGKELHLSHATTNFDGEKRITPVSVAQAIFGVTREFLNNFERILQQLFSTFRVCLTKRT